MADHSVLKENLRYLRFVIYAIVLAYIWVQYEFNTESWDYSNGQAKVIGKHVNGKDEGTWIWFYSNGKKQMQGDFLHGKRVGTWLIWDSSGNKVSETHYVNDKLNGDFIRWYSNGKIESKGTYKDDKLVYSEDYKADGSAQ
ncbi:MAG: hypothetical protein J5I91_08935 [Bacteroidetes bacterium]|nr:hypothetical protein [Bacteroidota bacterium]